MRGWQRTAWSAARGESRWCGRARGASKGGTSSTHRPGAFAPTYTGARHESLVHCTFHYQIDRLPVNSQQIGPHDGMDDAGTAAPVSRDVEGNPSSAGSSGYGACCVDGAVRGASDRSCPSTSIHAICSVSPNLHPQFVGRGEEIASHAGRSTVYPHWNNFPLVLACTFRLQQRIQPVRIGPQRPLDSRGPWARFVEVRGLGSGRRPMSFPSARAPAAEIRGTAPRETASSRSQSFRFDSGFDRNRPPGRYPGATGSWRMRLAAADLLPFGDGSRVSQHSSREGGGDGGDDPRACDCDGGPGTGSGR
jgi:hypothetical protein